MPRVVSILVVLRSAFRNEMDLKRLNVKCEGHLLVEKALKPRGGRRFGIQGSEDEVQLEAKGPTLRPIGNLG